MIHRDLLGRAAAVLGLAGLGALFLLRGPIPQDQAYHAFADARTLLGVPHFNDVFSNLGFLAVGVLGLRRFARRADVLVSWKILFAGMVLLAFGSGYYHWAPRDATLFWDRLSMTVGFMALAVALAAEHLGASLERKLLVPALILGPVSLLVWLRFDDLRLYAWVQFFPMLLIPLLLVFGEARYTHRSRLLGALALYAGSKTAEAFDRAFFDATGGVYSGHSVKHWLAAGAVYCVYAMLRDRREEAR